MGKALQEEGMQLFNFKTMLSHHLKATKNTAAVKNCRKIVNTLIKNILLYNDSVFITFFFLKATCTLKV